jgi:plastocyanin
MLRSLRRLAPPSLVVAFLLSACREAPERRHQPDALLRAELGLKLDDRVHSIWIAGGGAERADPELVSVEPGAYVEFITTDWLVHEVIFEIDSLTAEQRAFLQRTDQVASPPLIERDSRYVLALDGAPHGRYPYRLEGNGLPGRGAIVVAEPGPT